MAPLRFQCPQCRSAETAFSELPWRCPVCSREWRVRASIVDGLTDSARANYKLFFEHYLAIHNAEGRRSEDPAYYLELPYRRGGRPTDGQWPMRARTYRFFERRILTPLERDAARPLRILDLGAGVGWLSYRLALRGHEPVAVDLLHDPLNGLGAAHHYHSALERPFRLIQSELDRVPLAGRQFDLAVFNASFHCAVDYRAALSEVRRLVDWGGKVVILDTPVYEHYSHGEQAREERYAELERRHGFRSDFVLSIEYLDERMIEDLARDLNIRWRIHQPWYGLSWHLRPLRAKLRGSRPPARFKVLVGSWASA